MIQNISQECIGQYIISKKRKRLLDEVEVFEGITKRPGHWNPDGAELDATNQIFTEM